MLHDIAKRCAATAAAKGFDACTWENLPTKLMFVVTEIDEACEAMEEDAQESKVGEELADIAIRTLVVLETLWPDDWSEGRIVGRYRQTRRRHESPWVMLWPLLRYARIAIHHWRMDEHEYTRQSLELLLLELWRLADRIRIDLDGCIQLKADANELRPARNGKKRSEG